MKPELRKALEAELDRLNARAEAVKVLLETSEKTPTVRTRKRDTASQPKKTDGRKLRWQNATPKQKAAWASAIRAGRKRQKRDVR